MQKAIQTLQRSLLAVARIDVGSSCYETPEMQQAGKQYVAAIRKFLRAAEAKDVKSSTSHFERTLKFTAPDGQRWAIYSGDFRNWCGGHGPANFLAPYFRTVRDDKDHTGGHNEMQPVDRLGERLARLAFKQEVEV